MHCRLQRYLAVTVTSALIIASPLLSGCSVHYYNEKTQTEHIWGIGHMQMKVSEPKEGLKLTASGTDLIGLGLSNSRDDFSLVGGLSRKKHLEVIDKDASVRLEWPTNSFFNVRVGSKAPFEKNEDLEAEK